MVHLVLRKRDNVVFMSIDHICIESVSEIHRYDLELLFPMYSKQYSQV